MGSCWLVVYQFHNTHLHGGGHIFSITIRGRVSVMDSKTSFYQALSLILYFVEFLPSNKHRRDWLVKYREDICQLFQFIALFASFLNLSPAVIRGSDILPCDIHVTQSCAGFPLCSTCISIEHFVWPIMRIVSPLKCQGNSKESFLGLEYLTETLFRIVSIKYEQLLC